VEHEIKIGFSLGWFLAGFLGGLNQNRWQFGSVMSLVVSMKLINTGPS